MLYNVEQGRSVGLLALTGEIGSCEIARTAVDDDAELEFELDGLFLVLHSQRQCRIYFDIIYVGSKIKKQPGRPHWRSLIMIAFLPTAPEALIRGRYRTGSPLPAKPQPGSRDNQR